MMEENISFNNDYMILELEISKTNISMLSVDHIGEFDGLQLAIPINDPYKQRYVHSSPCYNVQALYTVLRFRSRKIKINL